MQMRFLAILLGLVPSVATAQTVTNQRTGTSYSSLESALGAGTSGDTYEVDGDVEGASTIKEDVVLVASAGGGSLYTSSGVLLTLEDGVDLTVEGVDLTQKGDSWVVEAPSSNSLHLEALTVHGAVAYVASQGGMLHIEDPVSVTISEVEFRGTEGVALAGAGGAIWVSGAAAMVLTDTTFVNVQTTGHGGAIFSSMTAVTCTRCTFDHTVGGFGGAIHYGGAPLTVEQSLFCGTRGSLGGAIFGTASADIVATAFVETTASAQGGALFVDGGDWLIQNAHFLGADVDGSVASSAVVYGFGPADTVEIRNALFLDNDALPIGVTAVGAGNYDIQYNWFTGNGKNADVTLDATNDVSETDPGLVQWSADKDCDNDTLWPTPFTSPLLDMGDPALVDADGTRSDIGAFGGPDADVALFGDADKDGVGFFWDCAEGDATITDQTWFWPDCDQDGQGNPEASAIERCFEPVFGPLICPGQGAWAGERDLGPLAFADCDDAQPVVFTGAVETCDALDRDCDGHPYTGAVDAHTWYLDLDRDRFGSESFEDCGGPFPGWSRQGGDCDDTDEDAFPGAPDACGDGVDQDCDGGDGTPEVRVTWYVDADGDGFGAVGSSEVAACHPLVLAGHARRTGDCNDTDAAVSPGRVEQCNGFDDNCDGVIDNVEPVFRWYPDDDGDGVGSVQGYVDAACRPEGAWVDVSGDCNDDDPLASECSCGCASGGSPGGGWIVGLVGLLALRRRTGRSGGAA